MNRINTIALSLLVSAAMQQRMTMQTVAGYGGGYGQFIMSKNFSNRKQRREPGHVCKRHSKRNRS